MFDIKVNIDRATLHLGKLPDAVRDELKLEANTLAVELRDKARANAASMFHVRTGRYRKSIRKSVRMSRAGVTGKVYSKSPVAHVLEKGAVRPPHWIAVKSARVLAFMMRGTLHFAARVRNPGSRVEGHAVINEAFQAMKAEIRDGLAQAVRKGAAAADASAG